MNDDKIELDLLRRELDGIDKELMPLLEKRLRAAERIGEYKRAAGLPVTDAEREVAVKESRLASVSSEYAANAERLLEAIMEESKNVQRKGLNIYLLGMPDCGKTRLGKRLAGVFDMPLADTDRLIMQRMNVSIDEIFASMGEEAFRSMETMVLAQIVRKGGLIVATGGGLPLWGDNAGLMKQSGVTVFLDRRLDALLGQNTKNRPLLREGGSVDENIKRLYEERRPRYLRAADITADPDAPDALAIISERIRSALQNK